MKYTFQDAFYGGRTQNFMTYCVPNIRHQKVEYLDVVSLYPSLLRKIELPLGRPQIIYDNVPLESGKPLPYKGIYKLDILPPRGLMVPIIPLRANEKLLFPLCRSCAVDNVQGDCPHADINDRFIHATVCHPELELALENGYRVLKVFEIWHFDQWTTGIFKELVDKYIKLKEEASGYPKTVGNDPIKQQEYREKYEAENGIRLEHKNIQFNPGLRYLAKLGMNSLWGKRYFLLNLFKENLVKDQSKLRLHLLAWMKYIFQSQIPSMKY